MREIFWLDDEAWGLIEPHLPRNKPGRRRVDDRRIISGIIHVLKSGCRRKDCPPEYGPPTTVYNRFNRWARKDYWDRILQARKSSLNQAVISNHNLCYGNKP